MELSEEIAERCIVRAMSVYLGEMDKRLRVLAGRQIALPHVEVGVDIFRLELQGGLVLPNRLRVRKWNRGG